MATIDQHHQNYDRTSELIAFDETKGGVKALVDAGITKVPRIFYSEQVNFPVSDPSAAAAEPKPDVLTIDLDSIGNHPAARARVVGKVLDASANYGFFQVVNHGIPAAVMEEMLEGVRRFYEQETEVKKQWYTRDHTKTVAYNSNYDLFTASCLC